MLINREMNKDVADIYNGIFTIRKEQNDAICSDMDRSRDYHTKWSKSKKDSYHMISLICGIKFLKMIQMNLFTKQKQPHRSQNQI